MSMIKLELFVGFLFLDFDVVRVCRMFSYY